MSDKKIIGLIIAGSLIFIIAAYFVFSGTNTPEVHTVSYRTTDTTKPQAKVTKDSADFGQMKVSDQKSNDFIIKNIGSKPLQLSNIESSCMCTVGQVIYQGKASQEFGMHSQTNYVAEIAPGTEATIKVTYRPYLMPVYGYVEREVYVTTNDPLNSKLVFKVTATVQ